MANTTIKITQLPNIGNGLAANTLLPVVNTTGTAITEKVTVGNVANFILTEAGNSLPAAFVSQIAYNVTNAAQPNITSVGTLTGLSIDDVANLNIPGGTNGQYLQTDGAGNLTWVTGTGSGNGTPGGANSQLQFNLSGNFAGDPELTWDAGNNQLNTVNFAASHATIYGNLDVVDVNATGNLVPNAIYTDHYYYANGYVFGGGGGNGVPGGSNTQVQFNDNGVFGGNAGFIFNKTTGIFTSPFLAGDGNGLSNVQGANVSGAVGLSTYAGTANAVAGANVSGAVTYAGTANSVAVGNVVGIGNIATLALDGNSSNVLYGNGVFAAASGNNPFNQDLNTTDNVTFANITSTDVIKFSNLGNIVGAMGYAPNYVSIEGYGSNSVNITANDIYTWTFGGDGTTIFPTLTVDIHNGGNQSAQTLQFGDPSQQAIITGPTPAANVNAQRLIIQGQRGNGTGEGGDVYFWAGDADTNGGDIKIYAGDADNVSTGYGGYINLDGGSGFDNGGQVNITGGYSANGQGGAVSVSAGQGGTDGGAININGGSATANQGGNISLQAGYGGNNGGEVRLTGGSAGTGLPGYGNVVLVSGASTWTFDNAGVLNLPGGTSTIESTANNISIYSDAGQLNGALFYDTGSEIYALQDFAIFTDNANASHIWRFYANGNMTAPGAINVGNMVIGTVPGDITADANTGVTFNVSGPDGGFAVNYLDEVGNANTSGGELAFSSETGNATYRISLSDDLGNGFATKIWRFDGTGNLVLAGGNSVIYSIANSSLDPTNPNVSTMTLTPDANYNSQVLVLDPTAPGHIHLRAYAFSNIDEPAANIFLGGEDTAFEITSGANNEARIHSNNYTWTFGNDGTLLLPRDAAGNTDPYLWITGGNAPSISSVDVSLGGPANFQIVSDYLNLSGYSGAKVAIKADNGEIATDANMVLTTNNANVGNTYSWTFDTAGNLTLPGNTFAVNYANGTQVSLGGGSYGDSNVVTLLSSFGSNTITTTGNVAVGAMTASGKIGYASGSTVTQTTNRGQGVTINSLAGTIVTTSDTIASGDLDLFYVNNNKVDSTSDIVLVQVISYNPGTYLPIAQPVSSPVNGFALSITNISAFASPTEAITIRFMVIKSPNA